MILDEWVKKVSEDTVILVVGEDEVEEVLLVTRTTLRHRRRGDVRSKAEVEAEATSVEMREQRKSGEVWDRCRRLEAVVYNLTSCGFGNKVSVISDGVIESSQ